MLLERAAEGDDGQRGPGRPAAVRPALRDTERPRRRRGSRRRCPPRWPRCCDAHPLRDLLTVEGPLPVLRRPGAGAVLQLVRVLPALRGRACRTPSRPGRQRHLPHRRRAAPRRRRDGLRRALPAADPPHRRGQPQGPEQHPRPRRPTTSGSPWAIGSAGRRPRRHPPRPRRLRRLRRLRRRGPRLGLEVALDFALQASPDHPWATEHPEWFTTRADGTIAYAENPPKKYQDIYPINFDNDPEGLYAEVLRIVRLWIVARRDGSSGSTTRTPSRSTSGSG